MCVAWATHKTYIIIVFLFFFFISISFCMLLKPIITKVKMVVRLKVTLDWSNTIQKVKWECEKDELLLKQPKTIQRYDLNCWKPIKGRYGCRNQLPNNTAYVSVYIVIPYNSKNIVFADNDDNETLSQPRLAKTFEVKRKASTYNKTFLFIFNKCKTPKSKWKTIVPSKCLCLLKQ